MAVVASDWTDWADATTWAGEYSPSAFTDWAETLIATGDVSPSAWSEWDETTVATGGDSPSDWSPWVGAETADTSFSGARFTPEGWVELDAPRRRTPAGDWVLLDGLGTPTVSPDPLVVPSQWSNWAATSTTPATVKKPLIGVIGSDEAAFNSINAQLGGVRVRRTYDTALPSRWSTSKAASDVAAGRMSLWSWKPSVLGFPTSDAQKAAFSAFLDTIPAGHECVIMAWHEPENDIPASWSLNQWGALQNAIATIIKSKNRPELRTGFCLMGPWTFDTRSGRTTWNWEGALDFDLIDVIGIDPYGTAASGAAQFYSLEQLLTVRNSGSGSGTAPSMMEKLRQWGKPVSIMEFGKFYEGSTIAPESVVAAWIHDAYHWMVEYNQTYPTTPIESALWYNMTLLGEDTPLTGLEITAYAEIVADSKIP